MLNKIFLFIIGTTIGSFLNVIIDRLPKSENILGRSHCDHCRHKLAWYDLMPVLSFVILGGKSRCCHKKLSWQYPIVEIVTGMLFIFIFFQGQNLIGSVLIIGIMSCLIVIFFSDLKYHLISDYILWALFVFSVIYRIISVIPANLPAQAGTGIQIPYQVGNDIASGLLVGLPIFLIYHISHERAMGFGDVLLTGLIGFLLGWKAGFLALYIAFVTGAIYGIILMILHRKKIKSKIPFGPFLVIGTVAMLFYGEKIFGMIGKIYGF